MASLPYKVFVQLIAISGMFVITVTGKAGPVINSNFADPSLIEVNGTYFAFATGNNGVDARLDVQMASSKDFSTWTLHHDYNALHNVGGHYGQVWAPDLSLAPDKSAFNLFFTAITPQHNKKHCIYGATAAKVGGPYKVIKNGQDGAIACDLAQGGDIDPTFFVDDALSSTAPSRYLIYKQDGNAAGSEYWQNSKCRVSTLQKSTPLMIQLMDPISGVKALGKPRVLFENINSDGTGVEAPSLLYDSGYYYLIFNEGCYQDETYSVHYAICRGQYLAGCKWERAKHALLQSGQKISGATITAPGGVSIQAYTNSNGEKAWRMVFHGDLNLSWFSGPGKKGKGERVRGMYAAEVVVERGTLRAGQLY